MLGEPCVFRTSRLLLYCYRVAQFVQYLCIGDIEQRTVTQSWQYLCTGDIE